MSGSVEPFTNDHFRDTRRTLSKRWPTTGFETLKTLLQNGCLESATYDEFWGGFALLLGYVRMSTDKQHHSMQIDALKKAGVERLFEETASGLKSDRPVLQQMIDGARPGDVIVVYSLSRIGRSIRHLLDLVQDLGARQIGLKSLTETIDTTTAQGRFVFTLFSALNQFEVELLRERTRAGLAAARARGRTGGRPRALVGPKIEMAKTLLSSGEMTVGEIARQLEVSPGTLYRTFPGGRTSLCPGGV